MAKNAISMIDRLEPATIRRAAELTGSATLPVPMNEVARAMKVRQMRILPLLCRAGVRRLVDGYELIVNTEAPGVTAAPNTSFGLDAPEWRNLGSALRFWIAHELAHLVYIECAGGKQPRISEDALEKGCSRLARILVLPTRLMGARVSADCFNPEHLTSLAKEAGVSVQVLIYRLAQADLQRSGQGLDGFVALGEQENGVLAVRAAHVWGPQATARFGSILKRDDDRSATLSDLGLGREFEKAALGGEAYLSERQGVLGANSALPCRVHALQVSPSYGGYLVGVQVLGQPSRIAQNGLFDSSGTR